MPAVGMPYGKMKPASITRMKENLSRVIFVAYSWPDKLCQLLKEWEVNHKWLYYDGSGLVKNSIKILAIYPVGTLMFESTHSKQVKKNNTFFGTNKLYSITLATFIVNKIS